jgi:hypothetical protein
MTTSFKNESSNNIGVEKSEVMHLAELWKVGTSCGWTSSQLPVNLTKGKYKIEVEIIDSPAGNNCIHTLFV